MMRGTKVFAGELSRTQDDILVAAIEAAIEEHGGSLTSLEVRRNGQLVLKYPDDYLSRSSETQVAA